MTVTKKDKKETQNKTLEISVDNLLKADETMEKLTRKMPANLEQDISEINQHLEELDKTLGAAFTDYTVTLNKFSEKMETMTAALKDAINKILDITKTIAETTDKLASRRSGSRKQATHTPQEFNISLIPEPYRDKIKITQENGKVVVRKSGFLGANKEESNKRWKELNSILRDYGINWVRGGGPNNDYRWES